MNPKQQQEEQAKGQQQVEPSGKFHLTSFLENLGQEKKATEPEQVDMTNTAAADWRDPFDKEVVQKFDEQGNQIIELQPTQFQRMWYFFQDDFHSKFVTAKEITIELLKILLIVAIYAFFGMLLIIYYACYPQHLKNQKKDTIQQDDQQGEKLDNGNSDSKSRKSQKSRSSKRGGQSDALRKRLSKLYDIPELLATLWYNFSHLVFWRSTIAMGDDPQVDMNKQLEKITSHLKKQLDQKVDTMNQRIQNNKQGLRRTAEEFNAEAGDKNNGAPAPVVAAAAAVNPDDEKPEKQSEHEDNQDAADGLIAGEGKENKAVSIDLNLYNSNNLESDLLVEPTYTARAMGYTKKKRVVILGVMIPFEGVLYGIFLLIGTLHFRLLWASLTARPDHLLHVVLLSMCWGYLFLNLIFITLWLVAMSVGNWHRKTEEQDLLVDMVAEKKIPQNTFFLQFLGKLSNRSLWSDVGAFKNVDRLDDQFQVDGLEWRNGLATFHYYLFIFHQYSLSSFRYCLPEGQKDNYTEYERQLTKVNSGQFDEIYCDKEDDIKQHTSGFWFWGCNYTILKLVVVIAIITRFLFLIIAFWVDYFNFQKTIKDAEDQGLPVPERRNVAMNNWSILLFFIIIYIVQFVGFRIYSNRKRKLHAMIRLSGLLDYLDSNYEQKGTVPNELPPLNVFCLLSLESWYSLRRLLNRKIRLESRFFDIELTISLGLVLLIILVTILGYLNLNNIDWVYGLIRTNTLAMFGFYIDFFLLVMITGYKLSISADINDHKHIHKSLLEKHLFVLKSLNGANIMASNVDDGEDFNSRCLKELKKQTKFYILNGTLECVDEGLNNQIKQSKITKISEIDDHTYEQAIVTAFARYMELLIEKVETIVQKIDYDELQHREQIAFILPVRQIFVTILYLGSLAILLPLTTGKWVQYDQMSFIQIQNWINEMNWF